ncbi:MAG: glycerophosphodiester phosphodiesterase [Turicibacter sp.]|nr:glycerophosphodiester phosphodiesterase [Turicibacter sp.]
MKTNVYAHRGSKGHYPENTMLAFKKAIEVGVDGIELDVHLTKDGEIVVIHDATLDRTTTGTGNIKDRTLAEIQAFSAGAKFGEFKQYDVSWDLEVVPSLAETLALLNVHDVMVNIELKTYEVDYPGIEEKVLKVVTEAGYDQEKIVYSSFHLPTLLRIQRLNEAAKIAWLVENFIPMPADYLNTLGLEALHMDKQIVLAHREYWRPMASNLRVWTVNEGSEMHALLELGVRAIITDYPESALNARNAFLEKK